MMAVASAPAHQPTPAFPAMSELYAGLSIRSKEGQVKIITIRKDQVHYTVNGATKMYCKSQAEFREAFMAPRPPAN